jgi:hypothetical protein
MRLAELKVRKRIETLEEVPNVGEFLDGLV